MRPLMTPVWGARQTGTMKSIRRYGALAFAFALVVGACSDSDDESASSTTVAPATSAATTSTTAPAVTTTTIAACTPADGYEPGTTSHTLTVAGAEREFLVHVPPAPTAAMALVVDFHGAGSDMNQQSIYSGFDPVADEHGFVVASPNGIDAAVRQWRFLGTDDDITFAKAVVADLVANACVDDERVFAAGISSGAAMSTRLACSASDTFHGFGLVAADFYNEALCGAAEARPMVIFHGTDDVIVPYAGGPVNAGPASSGLSVQPAEESAAAWATHHGCAGDPIETEVSEHVVQISWDGCDAPVEFYRVDGGGHTWPGAAIPVDRLGPTTDEISATELMWDAFSTL